MWLVLGSDTTARRLAFSLKKRGISARHLPVVLRTHSDGLVQALSTIKELDTSIFTSQTAVELVFSYGSESTRKAVQRSVCYAIGPATARRIRERYGKRRVWVPREFTSNGLISLLAEREIGRCALFSSEKRSHELVKFLRQHSTILHVPVLYDLHFDFSLVPKVAEAIQSECTGVVFTCSTAFEGIPDALLPTLGKLNVVAMGSRSAAAMRRKGLTVVVPESSSVQGVASLVTRLTN